VTLLAVSALPVLVGTAIAGFAWAATAEAVAERQRSPEHSGVVMSWNVHFAVNAEGGVDPEALADSIAAQNADVVLLQEVSRGWTLAGGLDLATWLSNRLRMHIAFAPAADRQFGNAILAPVELRDVTVHALPYGDGPQKRSAVSALAYVGDSEIRVTSVHLQHHVSNAATRLHQVESLLSHLSGTGVRRAPGIIGGDFNAAPGSAEMKTMTTKGHYLSAVDIAGDPRELTSPNPDPLRRIDWILGREVTFVDADVLDDPMSDHRPLTAQVRP
jgi:endonuclease/exonuclease/phosphatase family metal-dependent hydrolase